MGRIPRWLGILLTVYLVGFLAVLFLLLIRNVGNTWAETWPRIWTAAKGAALWPYWLVKLVDFLVVSMSRPPPPIPLRAVS